MCSATCGDTETGTENYVWRKADRIGKGQFCKVFKGRHRKTGKEVAIKLCNLSRCTTGNGRRYIEDVDLLLKFNSPFITRYVAQEKYGSADEAKWAIVMELADGSLRAQIKENRYGIPKEKFLVLVDNCVKGLEYLDAQNLCHRDIKPDNILVFRKPGLTYKFCDFGLSHLVLNPKESMTSFVGTLCYMPVFMIKENASEGRLRYTKDEYDVYATACCFFEAATGQRPFQLREDKPFKSEMWELSRMQRDNIVCARFNTKKGKYVYKKRLPRQHTSYTSEFRRELSDYFRLLFSKDKRFLDIGVFAELSRELVRIKDYRNNYMNMFNESHWKYELNESPFPSTSRRKPFFPALVPLRSFNNPLGYRSDFSSVSEYQRSLLEATKARQCQSEVTDPSEDTVLSEVIKPLATRFLGEINNYGRNIQTELANRDGGDAILEKVNAQLNDIIQLSEKLFGMESNAKTVLDELTGQFDELRRNKAESTFASENDEDVTVQNPNEGTEVNVAAATLEVPNETSSEKEDKLSCPPNTSYYTTGPGVSMLLEAVEEKNYGSVVFLLKSQVWPDTAYENGESVLCRAASSGDLDMVKLLVENGASIEFINHKGDGWTPLHYASAEGHCGIVEYFLEHKADIDVKTMNYSTPLICAAEKNQHAAAKLLIERGADIYAADHEGKTVLMSAASSGDLDLAKLLIRKGVDIGCCRSDGLSALHFACQGGYVNIVGYLVENGADLDAMNTDGCTPLMLAAKNGRCSVVSLLIKSKANIDASDEDGVTVLQTAVFNGHLGVVKLLLEAGAAVNTKEEYVGFTPLHDACFQGHSQIVELLLDGGADINARTGDGWTPLMVAAQYGRHDAAEVLIRRGPDVNAVDSNGLTAVCAAVFHGHLDVVKLLVQHGGCLNNNINIGIEISPLHCCFQGENPEIASYLVDNGADVNARTAYGETPLFLCARCGSMDVAKLLMEKNADVNAVNTDGDTPLIAATRAGHHELAKMLIQNGAEVDAKNDWGFNSFRYASQLGYRDTAEYLLGIGTDIDAKDSYGYTTLTVAVMGGQNTLADQLIGHGAKVNERANFDVTALHQAANIGNLEAAKLLVDNGASVAAKDKLGDSPLFLACLGRHTKFAEYLLEKGADVNERNALGRTPLIGAAIQSGKEMMKLLTDRGANLNDANDSGCTALIEAAKWGNLEAVEYLLQSGASVNVANRCHQTAVHCACEKGHLEIVSRLVEKGADMAAKTNMGLTPIMVAEQNNRADILAFLREREARESLILDLD